jgi:hypothetical protein
VIRIPASYSGDRYFDNWSEGLTLLAQVAVVILTAPNHDPGYSLKIYTTISYYVHSLNSSFLQLLCFLTLSIVMPLSRKHCPVYFSKYNISETGFCLRLQVKPTHLYPIDRATPCLRTHIPAPRWGIPAKHGIGNSSIDWAKLSRFYLKTEAESSLRIVVFKNKQDGVF